MISRVKRSNLLSIYHGKFSNLSYVILSQLLSRGVSGKPHDTAPRNILFEQQSLLLARYRSAALPLASVVLSASIERQLRMA